MWSIPDEFNIGIFCIVLIGSCAAADEEQGGECLISSPGEEEDHGDEVGVDPDVSLCVIGDIVEVNVLPDMEEAEHEEDEDVGHHEFPEFGAAATAVELLILK